MIHQYNPQRFRHLYPPKAVKRGKNVAYVADPRDKRVGTIAVGTILYIQDGARRSAASHARLCAANLGSLRHGYRATTPNGTQTPALSAAHVSQVGILQWSAA